MGKFQAGSKHPKAKLTMAKVRRLRVMHKSGISLRVLAAKFGVSHMAIKCAVDGVTWKDNG